MGVSTALLIARRKREAEALEAAAQAEAPEVEVTRPRKQTTRRKDAEDK